MKKLTARPTASSVLLAVILALIMVPSAGSATTVKRISLETMTLASDLIVHGVVASSRAETVAGNARHIRTVVRIDITEVVRDRKDGDRARKTLELAFPGGRVGKWETRIPGMPSFAAGEEVVLFLEKTRVSYALTGLSQGKFSVKADADGRKQVRRTLGGLHFVAENRAGQIVPVEPPAGSAQALDALLGQVRATLRNSRARKPAR